MSSSFSSIKASLLPSTMEVIESLGFENMTPVQAATIPLFLGNKDVCVEACTGSGKTLAYVIPTIERVMRVEREWLPGEVGGLILSPTRELAKQIYSIVELFTQNSQLKSRLLIGGTDVQTDIDNCIQKGANIVVATPGRLVDLIRRNNPDFHFRKLEVLVLDEADTLLDMGFSDSISEILSHLPKQRRTGLFSATQTQEVRALAKAGLRNPAVIAVKVRFSSKNVEGSQATPLTLRNFFAICPSSADKLSALAAFLRERAAARDKCIIFVATCAGVDYFSKMLQEPRVMAAMGLEATFPVLGLHGQMDQRKRSTHYSRFEAAECGALICTDVAARGIDIPDVDWICQFDPPQDPSFFVHRVGRTARAGRQGCALVLLVPRERGYVSVLRARNVPLHPWPLRFIQLSRLHDAPEAMQEALQALQKTNAPLIEEFIAKVSPAQSVNPRSTSGAEITPAADVHAGTFCAAPQEGEKGAEEGSFDDRKARLESLESLQIAEALQQESLSDRDALERGSKAFISFLRSYREHHCRFVFRPHDLNVLSLALVYGLLKLPKLDELRVRALRVLLLVPYMQTHLIAYRDKTRESARQARLAAQGEKLRIEREERDERRRIALEKKAALAEQKEREHRKRTHKGRNKRLLEDWELLAKEEKLEKKLKKGLVSKKEYKRQLGLLHRAQGIAAEDDEVVQLISLSDSEEMSDSHNDEASVDESEEDIDQLIADAKKLDSQNARNNAPRANNNLDDGKDHDGDGALDNVNKYDVADDEIIFSDDDGAADLLEDGENDVDIDGDDSFEEVDSDFDGDFSDEEEFEEERSSKKAKKLQHNKLINNSKYKDKQGKYLNGGKNAKGSNKSHNLNSAQMKRLNNGGGGKWKR